jgi:hypothetical protein
MDAREINKNKWRKRLKLLKTRVWTKDTVESLICNLSMANADCLSFSIDIQLLEVFCTDKRAKKIKLARYVFRTCQHFIFEQKFFVDQREFFEILELEKSNKVLLCRA